MNDSQNCAENHREQRFVPKTYRVETGNPNILGYRQEPGFLAGIASLIAGEAIGVLPGLIICDYFSIDIENKTLPLWIRWLGLVVLAITSGTTGITAALLVLKNGRGVIFDKTLNTVATVWRVCFLRVYSVRYAMNSFNRVVVLKHTRNHKEGGCTSTYPIVLAGPFERVTLFSAYTEPMARIVAADIANFLRVPITDSLDAVPEKNADVRPPEPLRRRLLKIGNIAEPLPPPANLHCSYQIGEKHAVFDFPSRSFNFFMRLYKTLKESKQLAKVYSMMAFLFAFITVTDSLKAAIGISGAIVGCLFGILTFTYFLDAAIHGRRNLLDVSPELIRITSKRIFYTRNYSLPIDKLFDIKVEGAGLFAERTLVFLTADDNFFIEGTDRAELEWVRSVVLSIIAA